MRIAITSDIYYPMTNGVAVFLHNLAVGLSKVGHEVLVIHPSPDGEARTEVDDFGVKTVLLKSYKMPLYPDQIAEVPEQKEFLGVKVPRLFYKNGLRYSMFPYDELAEALDEFQPDVVHLQTAEFVAAATLRYVRKHGTPLVSTGHAYPDNITGQLKLLAAVKPLKQATDAALKVYMASYLKHSEYATMPTEMAIGDLLPKNRKRFRVPVEALSNGVDLLQFKPGKANAKVLAKYGLEKGRPRVLYVGRVDPEKSIGHVIEAFSRVAPKVSEAELVVVGDGIDLERLKELAEDLKLGERAKFLGKVLPPDLIEIYQDGMVFATASETETQGIVLIEAAATGLPLIAVDAGAVGELCQNKVNGILCRPGDVSGMARAMKKILTEPELREKYSKESIKIAAEHDLKRTVARFEEIYSEAILLKAIEEE